MFDTVKMYSEDQTLKIIEQCFHSVMVLHSNKTGARNRSGEEEEEGFFKPLHSLSHNQLIRQLFQALVQWKQEQQQKQHGVISGQQQQQQERQKKVMTTAGKKSRNSSSSSSKIEKSKFSEQDIMWTVCKLFLFSRFGEELTKLSNQIRNVDVSCRLSLVQTEIFVVISSYGLAQLPPVVHGQEKAARCLTRVRNHLGPWFPPTLIYCSQNQGHTRNT